MLVIGFDVFLSPPSDRIYDVLLQGNRIAMIIRAWGNQMLSLWLKKDRWTEPNAYDRTMNKAIKRNQIITFSLNTVVDDT